MKKFNVSTIREDVYEIEIDENIWDKKALEDWSKVFHLVESTEELAESLSKSIMRQGSGNGHIEGFGYIKTLDSSNEEVHQIYADKLVYTEGIVLKIICENDDIECDIYEI